MADTMRFIVDEISKVPDDGDRRTILYGEVERGTITKGMNVHLEILGQDFKVRKVKADGEDRDEASTGDQVGVILDGLQNVRVQLGEVVVSA